MGDTEHEQAQDDLEIEIIDLDRRVETQFNASHGQPEDSNVSPPSLPRLRLSRWSQLTSTQRTMRLAVTISTVALALLIILGSIDPVRTTAQRLLFSPTPTPTANLVPGSDLFYFDPSPGWGKLSLDGKPVDHPPIMGLDAPIRLARGRHQLVWSADPFPPLRCSISVPIVSTDTCHYLMARQDEFGPTHPQIVPNSWDILLFEPMAALPSASRDTLEQAIVASLDTLQSTDTVYPGEHYVHVAAKHAVVDIATRPLHATLHFQMVTGDASNSLCTTDPTSCSIQMQGQDCQVFCTQPGQFPNLLHGWFVSVFVSTAWDYATLDGQIIAQNQPDGLIDITTVLPFSALLLQITWENGSWHVFQESVRSDLACPSTVDLMIAALPNAPNIGYQYNTSSGSVEAAGCLIAVVPQPNNSANPPSPSAPKAYYLYRFGVLLAANDLAHHLSPHTPLVDAYERKLAQQLIQTSQNL